MRSALAIPSQPAPRRAYPRGRRALAVAAAAAVLAALLGACGGDPARTRGAPVLTVVTGLWPLAQAASTIGQGNVRVVDVVPDGQDPLTYRLTPGQAARVRDAGLVLGMGPGLQPSFAAAAATAHRALDLTSALHLTNPYVWLNPHDMQTVATAVEAAMVRADPAARATFVNGLDNLTAVAESLDADYQSTLGDCPESTIVTVGTAFEVLHPRYQITVVAVDGPRMAPSLPDRAAVAREVATVRRAGVHAVYTEPWFPTGGLIPLQAQTRVSIEHLDSLVGVPPGGWAKGTATYFGRMELNLQALAGALRCPNPNEQQ